MGFETREILDLRNLTQTSFNNYIYASRDTDQSLTVNDNSTGDTQGNTIVLSRDGVWETRNTKLGTAARFGGAISLDPLTNPILRL